MTETGSREIRSLSRAQRATLRIVGWLIATALLVLSFKSVPVSSVTSSIANAHGVWILAALVANAAILFSWTGLWTTVTADAERIPYRSMFEINAMSSASMNTLPLLGGHAAAIVMLISVGGLSRAGALSVMALDQLGEGMAKVTLFATVALAAPVPEWMRAAIISACVAVALLLVVLLAAAHRHRVPVAGSGRMAEMLSHWSARLETLRDGKKASRAFLFALGTKAAELLGLIFVQHAFGVELSIGASALVLAAIVLGSMIPVAPANLGTYEAGAVLAYRHVGVDPQTATVLAIASHLCFLIPSIGIGYAIATAKHLRFWEIRRESSL